MFSLFNLFKTEKKSDAQVIYDFLVSEGEVSLSRLMDLRNDRKRIASVSTVISHARKIARKYGKQIQCRIWYEKGIKHSAYKIISDIS